MTGQEQNRFDDIYKDMSLDDIPWNLETPPELLVELVDTSKVRPCKAVDLGCGAGNYAVYLAGRGFEVTGVDISPTAIKIAKENAQRKSVNCNFIVADVVQGLDELCQTWQFAYGWGLLHHISPEQRQKYVENVSRILDPASKYLSVSFSQKDTGFAGSQSRRQSQLGTVLYLSSQDQLRKLFETHFQIINLRTIEIAGKFESHIFNYAFMQRK
ncbi:MAG: methyltransferase domain-containing protein [Planctomycetota bacterium]|nr:MAG: methyltransferase domain-containing protein [Planctomycetota bacterium]